MSALHHYATQPPRLWHNNPAMVQLLGLSPLLAVTTTVVNGIALGLATAIVFLFASITVAACRNLLYRRWRFVFFLFVLSAYTTLVAILLQRFNYALYRELGIYLPLICCNMFLLLHLEMHAQNAPIMSALRNACFTACGYVFALVLFAAVRESIILGTIGSNWSLLLMPSMDSAANPDQIIAPDIFPFARLAPAALILLGLLLALRNALIPIAPAKIEDSPKDPAIRARVTGKIQAP